MADAIGVNTTLPVRLGGVSTSSGLPDFYADVLSTGQLKVAISDASGNALNSTSNALNVFLTNTTIAVTQSTSPWVVSGTVTSNQGTSPWVTNISQFGGSVVVTGTGASGAGIPRVTVSNDSNILATQSGTWNINNITGTVSLPTGASTSALQTTGNTSLASIVTNTNSLILAQGSTTSGQTGNLGMGAVTTANPSYTNGQTDPLSLTTTGNLRVQDAADGPVTPGTVASFSQLAGGQFNTALPTLSNTQQSALQLDSSGRLIVSPSTSASIVTVSNLPTTVDTNYGAVGSSTIRTASQIGNATGGAAFGAGTTTAQVLRVVLPTDQTAIPVTQSGTWTVQQGTPPWTIQGDSASGASKAGNPVQISGVFNTTQPTVTTGQTVEAQSTARGALIVATGVDNFNINNITGTVSLPTGAATSALQTSSNTSLSTIVTNTNSLILTQGSTTSGQTGNLGMGAVTTSNPSYTSGQTDPLSLTTAGNLRVQDASDGPVTPGTVASFSQLAGGQFNTALPTLSNTQQSALQLDSSGRLIIAPSTGSSIVTVSNLPTTVDTNYGTVGSSTIRTASQIGNATGAANFGAGATGAQTLRVAANTYDGSGNAITSSSNGTAADQLLHVQAPDTTTASTALGALNATVSVTTAGLSSVGFQLASGTLIGTIVPECSIDGGTTWVSCTFFNSVSSSVTSSVVFSSANTLTVLSVLPIGGSSTVRVRVSAYTSGTANALMRASMVTAAAGAITAAAFGNVSNNYITLTANTTTQLLTANTNRKYAYISNNSGGLISIQFGTATGLTSTARGLVIPNGNFYELKGDNLYTGAVFAYTNASGLVVAVTEGTP